LTSLNSNPRLLSKNSRIWAYIIFILVNTLQKSKGKLKKENQFTYIFLQSKVWKSKRLDLSIINKNSIKFNWMIILSLYHMPETLNGPWHQSTHNVGEKNLCKPTSKFHAKEFHHSQAVWFGPSHFSVRHCLQ
jgi:hypothetical protein